MNLVSADDQGRKPRVVCLVDVSTELVHQTLHHFEVLVPSDNVERRFTVMALLVDISVELFDQQSYHIKIIPLCHNT
jgi:hypothetical protein